MHTKKKPLEALLSEEKQIGMKSGAFKSGALNFFFKKKSEMNMVLIVVVYALSYVDSFCDPMDCSQPGSSIHGISQTRIQKWVAISFSRGSSQHKDRTCISCLAGGFFITEPPGKPMVLVDDVNQETEKRKKAEGREGWIKGRKKGNTAGMGQEGKEEKILRAYKTLDQILRFCLFGVESFKF